MSLCYCTAQFNSADCEGVNYTTGREQYSQVCGRIIGYQLGDTGCFNGAQWSIDTWYIDGVSVTHGFPRQHIWTFAACYAQIGSNRCPCITGNIAAGSQIPSFVEQNYFCESGLTQYSNGLNGPFFSNSDPLWDGQGCGSTSSCCTFNSPPWFNVTLPSPTTDDIEVRTCASATSYEDSPIQLIELYVK